MVMALVTTLARYYAGHPIFHLGVTLVMALGAGLVALRAERGKSLGPETWALLAVGAPASISAVAGYVLRPLPDTLMGFSAWLYVAGSFTFVVIVLVRATQQTERPTPEPGPDL